MSQESSGGEIDVEAIKKRHQSLFRGRYPSEDIVALLDHVAALTQRAEAQRQHIEQQNELLRRRQTEITGLHRRAEDAERERDAKKDYAERMDALAEERWVEIQRLRAVVEGVRTEVLWFAFAMEERLQANDHKGGWGACDFDYLLRRLREEAAELKEAHAKWSRAEVRQEAADVANFAMMIADRFGALAALDSTATADQRSGGGEEVTTADLAALSRYEHDMGEAQRLIREQREQIAGLTRRAEDASTFRERLWLDHGHIGLYADNGEMQCGRCMIDFKRDSPAHIAGRIGHRIAQLEVDSTATAPDEHG